jgi:hypothetical protein
MLQGKPRKATLHHFDDLCIWLEFRLLAQTQELQNDLGELSRQFARELEGIIAPDLFAGQPLQPVLFVLLHCHQFCLSETIEPHEQKRFERMLATRQLDSLLDLMRVVVQRTLREHRLPDVGSLLDRLQAEGFNIEHQGFRDPYEARLVPLADTERFETARLPLFLALDKLTGDFAPDLEMSQQMLREWQRRIIQEAVNDHEYYALALAQPLPRAHLLRQLIRFAVSWVLAQHPWPVARGPEKLEETVRGLVPDGAAKHLVRPRKGYELKSKGELSRLIEAECRRQKEALERISLSHRIQGIHDYTQFVRYLFFQQLQERWGPDPQPSATVSLSSSPLVPQIAQPEWVSDIARNWSIDARQAYPHSLEVIREYLVELSPPGLIMPELEKSFVTSENERKRLYHGIIEQVVPAFCHLLVAYGRHTAQLERLSEPADRRDDIFWMMSLLAPPLETLERAALSGIQQKLAQWGSRWYRTRMRPCLFNVAEWKGHLAWELHQRLGDAKGVILEEGDLEQLLRDLEKCVARVDLPPRELFTETVQSTLLALLLPEDGDQPASDTQLRELMLVLPQLDCGACGQASCRAFARALLGGRAEPSGCVQLPSHSLPLLLERLEHLKQPGDGFVSRANPLDLLRDRQLWRASAEKEWLQNVLSATTQKARQLLLERLHAIWEKLHPRPQIFKCPDPESFYQELCRYLGYEAAERLDADEKRLLEEHGDVRQRAEWRIFKERQDWLKLANRSRLSRPLLRLHDPALVAQDGYREIFFLHQLSTRDRQLVLRNRMELHQDGFTHWWNEDLLTMNLPDFSIRDWEDFSKIIKNAYWHQESSLAPGDVVAILQSEALTRPDLASAATPAKLLSCYLGHLIDQGQRTIAELREQLRQFREGRPVRDVAELRDLLQGFLNESEPGDSNPAATRPLALMPFEGGAPMGAEERLVLDLENLWQKFQQERFNFSSDFCCHREELSSGEEEALEIEMAGVDDGRQPSGGGLFLISSWDEPLQKRAALIRALLMHAIRERMQQRAECEWLKTDCQKSASGRIPLGTLRLFVRDGLLAGKDRSQIEADIQSCFGRTAVGAETTPGAVAAPAAHETSALPFAAPLSPAMQNLLEDVLHLVVRKRQYELFCRSAGSVLPAAAPGDQEDAFLKTMPELRSFLDNLLEKHQTMDRERLLHYLFLLAKMEGNLDTLTALLREIRETSDIIEAAWLRFTEERIQESPAPKSLPGTTLGIPLLVSHLKDKDAVNVCLRDGISRREKKSVAAAASELINFIRYHVLLLSSGKPAADGVDEVVREIRDAGYDLTGIADDALRAAVGKEWKRRAPLADQKIWIYTMVTARRLAAQHAELQEAERTFYKSRLEMLKEGAGRDPQLEEIASRRGAALGQIKEEMYRQLSDLLESERIASFQKRIRQIVQQLDEKREEIYAGWRQGRIDRRTMFYLLRQYQKSDREPTWDELKRFLADHWFAPLAELRGSMRPDREERIQDLDERLRSLLGVSLLALEEEAKAAADQDVEQWKQEQLALISGLTRAAPVAVV